MMIRMLQVMTILLAIAFGAQGCLFSLLKDEFYQNPPEMGSTANIGRMRFLSRSKTFRRPSNRLKPDTINQNGSFSGLPKEPAAMD